MSSESFLPYASNETPVTGRLVFQRAAIEANVWQCCLNCNHWGNNDPSLHNLAGAPKSGCGKYGFLQPPPDVLVVGCEVWLSLVPF